MLDRDADGNRELWPLRPDRVSIVPDREEYIRGFVYHGRSRMVALTPDEVVWFRYFNPLEEYAGLSPVAPARLAIDMGRDGLRFNRNFLRNSAQPDFVMLTNDYMNDSEVEDFYRRWEARYRGPANAHRPAVASFVRDIKTLGLSHRQTWTSSRDCAGASRRSLPPPTGKQWREHSGNYLQALLVQDPATPRISALRPRARHLPIPTSTQAGPSVFFWRNTMVPEMTFLAQQVTRQLFPLLGTTTSRWSSTSPTRLRPRIPAREEGGYLDGS